MPTNPTWEETTDTLQAPSWEDTTPEPNQPAKVGLPSSYFDVGLGIASPGSLESKAWSEAGIPQTESIAPELFSKLKFDINPEEPWYKAAAKAASNLAVGIPEFISSPAGISGVYSGMVAPGTTKAFFAADMIKNAIQQAPELMDQWDKMTPAQKAASAVDLIGSLGLGVGLGKNVVGDVLKRYAPPAVKLARELETLEPEVKPGTPAAIRQLGVRVPEGPFAQPGIPELASAALGERFQMVKPAGAPEEGALMDLRRALEPPRVEIAQPVARAERIQGGGQAPYGKLSFMREAEAPLPERTQAALSEPAPKPAEPTTVEAASPVVELPKPTEVKPESVAQPKSYFEIAYQSILEKQGKEAADQYAERMKRVGEWRPSANLGIEPPKPPAVEPTPPPPSPEAQAKPAAAPTEVKTEAKQPWEMTKEEYKSVPLYEVTERIGPGEVTGVGNISVTTVKGKAAADLLVQGQKQNRPQRSTTVKELPPDNSLAGHEIAVRDAESLGKPVPSEVLKEYGISPKPPPPQPSAGIEKQGKEGKISPTDKGISKEEKAFRATAEGQKAMQSRASRIGTLLQMNEAIRKIDPNEAYPRNLIDTLPESQIDGMMESLRQTWNNLHKKPEQPQPGPGDQTVGETQPPQTKGIITGRAIEKWADDTLSGGATHLGPDVLAAYLVKGAALIERGIINFAEWSARMIAEHGDKVKPHLRELFAAAQETVKRAPVSESGTLKSAREIVESKLAQPEATPKTTTLAPAPTGTTLDDVYRIFEPVPKESTPIKQKGINSIEAVRTGFSSKFRPTNELAEQIAKSYGGTRKDIAGIFEQLKGSSGKGEAEIYRFDRDVSSLVKGQEQDFNAYMFLRRSLDRLRQDLADIQTAQAGGEVKKLNRRAVAKYTIPQLESKLSLLQQNLGPEGLQRFEQAAQRYQEYMDRALRLQVESGRMSQDLYQAIKDGNQFYAPFKVMKYLQEGMKPEGTGRKIDTVADYTKAMEGIEDPNFKLGDMLSAARQNLLISRILADKAVAMRNIADLAAIDTEGKFVRRLGKGQDIPEGTAAVNVFENGEKVRYAVPPHVAEALQIYGQTGGGIISRFLEGASIPFKVGATMLNIPFQFSNLMADVPRTALVSKYGVRGVTDLVRYPLDLVESIFSTMYSVVGKRPTKLYLDFLDSGAAGSAIQEYLTPKALAYRDPATMSKAKRIALNILYTPAEFAKAIEQTSKVLGVKRAIRLEGVKSGAELSKQIPDAITEIRRFSGSPDFGRQGKWTEQARLNLLYMFLNARIQGAVADVGRLTGRDGAKPALTSWIRLGIGVGVPTAYLFYLNNSPEYKADYDSRSQKEKDNYWLIPKDSFITNEQGERMRDFWKIPKRESSKWIGNMVESAMNFAKKQDPKAFAQFGQQMIEDISPVNIQGDTAQERLESIGSSLNPLIKAPLELATGRDLYRHRQLVPDTMQKASPEQQYTDRTSQAFITLAKAMPDVAPDVLRSPIMLENVTRNLTAGLITQFLPRKPVEGRGAIENIPLLQRFQAIPYLDNEAFRKEMEALERESADEYLMRHRTALEAIDKNKNQSLPVILKNTGFTDLKLIRHIVDLWVADQNGATSQDRRLIALPAKQRAEYIAKMLKPMTPEQKQKTILDLAKKRVLTEAVFQEMSQLPQ